MCVSFGKNTLSHRGDICLVLVDITEPCYKMVEAIYTPPVDASEF